MPAWDDDMEQIFGEEAPLFRTASDLNGAIFTLFYWRSDYLFEGPWEYRRQLEDPIWISRE